MTQNEKVKLKNLAPSTETDYQTAVDNLFRAPRTFIIDQILAMLNGSTLYVVPLSGALPSSDFDIIIGGLKAFRGKAGINQSSGEFYFLGEMTQTEKTTLLNVSGNPQYQAAVNVLFNAPRTKISEDLQQATQNDKDLEYFLQHITEYLRQTASESFVKQKLGEVLKLDAEIVKQVLTIPTYVYNNIPRKAMIVFRDMLLVGSDGNDSKDPITPTTHSDQFISFRFLEKVTRVISRLKITANEIPWLFQKGPDIGWLDLARLPLDSSSSSSSSFAPLERIVNTIQLRDNLPLRNESGLFYLFDKVMGLNSSATDSIKNTTKQEFLSVLSKWSSWSMDDLESLIGKKDEYHDTGLLDITFPDDYKNELMLLRLQSCFMMMKRLGVSAKMLSAWNKADQTSNEAFDNARSIKNVVKAKYENKQWLAVAKPLRDTLREKQRTALVSYLAFKRGVRDADELYDDFLIDVEMSPCMMSTRIRQALGSVQLFVQRCLMKLEPNVSLTPKEAEEWSQWRKHYRIWEANRKVFLYPENWIEPELRDNKSPFFLDLENELLQNDVTNDTVETAFLYYLEKLNEVSRLEICGMYLQQKDNGYGAADILHVFGRSFATPHIYYYRQKINSVWTAWEKIDIDIEGNHLIPIVWNRRLHLFWPIFIRKADEAQKLSSNKEAQKPLQYWEIYLAWSEYTNGKWSAKKMSSESEYLRSPESSNETLPEKENYTFKGFINNKDEVLTIRCYLTDTSTAQRAAALMLIPGGDTSGEGNLSGTVFIDLDKNGLRGSNEPAKDNILVHVQPDNELDGGLEVTKNTDQMGSYEFKNLEVGKYRIWIDAPTGYVAPLRRKVDVKKNENRIEIFGIKEQTGSSSPSGDSTTTRQIVPFGEFRFKGCHGNLIVPEKR